MFQFSDSDFSRIEHVLEGKFEKEDDSCYRMVIQNTEEKRKLSFEIYPDICIGKSKGNLISVYTSTSHLQLQFCSGYVVSDMLGEVTFVSECGSKLSGLIIEKGAACSLYANLDRDILSGDFTQLGPEVMLSGIALSLIDPMLGEENE